MNKERKENLIAGGIIFGALFVIVAITSFLGGAEKDAKNKSTLLQEYIKERTVSTEYVLPENISSQEELDKAVMDIMLWAEKQYSAMEELDKEAYAYSNEIQLDRDSYMYIQMNYIYAVEDKIIATLKESLTKLCSGSKYGKYKENKYATRQDYIDAVKCAKDIAENHDYEKVCRDIFTIRIVFGYESACGYAAARYYPDIYKEWSTKPDKKKDDEKENKKTNNSTPAKINYSTKKTNDTYDDGYEDVWLNDEPDWDRYESDPDYALGADDAMDEFDW